MLGRFEDAGKIPRSSRAGLRTSGKITTTNPQWGGRADLRIGGRSSDLLIGNQIHLSDPRKNPHFQDAVYHGATGLVRGSPNPTADR